MRPTRWIFAVAVLGLVLAGCSTRVAGVPVAASSKSGGSDRGLVERYFADLNSSGDDGTAMQRDFLRRTQHPDYTDRLCDLGDLVLHIEPAMSTFRTDADWVPPDSRASEPPRGTIYVLGVSVSIRQEGAQLGEQIGSERVVVLDGKAYGFSPCPTE
ncbi:MAG TPA: hypothetical protein VGP26_11305 [Actinophytocola sp.]|jgi:hypothetical protein|nr:hypothetical protein [Actinophytocola sp.]